MLDPRFLDHCFVADSDQIARGVDAQNGGQGHQPRGSKPERTAMCPLAGRAHFVLYALRYLKRRTESLQPCEGGMLLRTHRLPRGAEKEEKEDRKEWPGHHDRARVPS